MKFKKIYAHSFRIKGIPRWHRGTELPARAEDARDITNPWVRKMPWRSGHGNSLQYYLVPWTEEPEGTQSVGLQSWTCNNHTQVYAHVIWMYCKNLSLNHYFKRTEKCLHSELFLLWLKIKWWKNKKMLNGIINISTIIIVKADCPKIGRYMLHHLSNDF